MGESTIDQKIKRLFSKYPNVHLVFEDVQASSSFGIIGSSSLMHCKGLLEGIATGLGLKYSMVSPKTWQKEMWQGIRHAKKKTNRKTKKGEWIYKIDPKPTSEIAAKRLFPDVDLMGNVEIKYYADSSVNRKKGIANQPIPSKKKNAHDGIIDGLLIAEYGRRKYR